MFDHAYVGITPNIDESAVFEGGIRFPDVNDLRDPKVFESATDEFRSARQAQFTGGHIFEYAIDEGSLTKIEALDIDIAPFDAYPVE